MKCLVYFVAALSVASVCNSAGCPYAQDTNTTPDLLCSAMLLSNTEYRPVDGVLQNTCKQTGKSFEPYGRIMAPHYSDCQWAIRKAKSQKDLPTVRQVVNGVFRSYQRTLTTNYRAPNFMIAMMGQYIAHDIGSRSDLEDPTYIERCCNNWNLVPVEDRHPACITVEIAANDPDYAQFPHVNCVATGRSRSKNPDRHPTDAMNTVTAFLDHSNLYGNEESTSEVLKSGVGGQMIMDDDNIMAPSTTGGWISGDGRFGQTPQLASFHSIYQREHNRIAKILEAINPHWTDKRLFEETRRIVVAELQHIVYTEFLPAFIAPNILRYLEAPDVTAIFGTITFNEFNGAILRVMHSLIPAKLNFIAHDNSTTVWSFKSVLNNAVLLRPLYDDIVRGMLMQPVNAVGYDPELFHGIFNRTDPGPGIDLLSLDLIRGRDHGLPPYVDVLALHKGSPITTFGGLAPYISGRHIALLQGVYEAVEDVDLLAGALLEEPEDGFLMGPTSQLMFLKQFMRLKTADPYFYTNQIPLLNPKPFTNAQLNEIKKVNTNLIYCLNSGVEYVPRDPAYAPVNSEDVVSCSSLEPISFESWRETSN